MRKLEIKKLAIKLKWKQKEVEDAINELTEIDSVVNHVELLRICIDTENISARKSKLTRLISKYLNEENPINIISAWLLQPDICFKVWAVFNAIDKEKLTEKSFIKSKTFLEKKIELNPYLLCDQYLDFFLKKLSFTKDIGIIMNEVAKKSGFLIFNIKKFQDLASSYNYNPFLIEKHKQLVKNIRQSIIKENKEKEYWLIYVLVKILETDIGTMKAFRKIAEIKYGRREDFDINSKAAVIKTRYYELKPKAEKDSLSVDDIVRRYNLEKAVADFFK